MAKKERSLVLDIGSTALHMAEFEYQQAGLMILHAFSVIEYDEAPNEGNRTQVISAALRKALDEKKFTEIKTCSLCVSGQAAFMRFVKLPPVAEEESRVTKIGVRSLS